MTLEELRNVDLNNLGSAPLPVRVAVIVLLCAAIAGTGYWYLIKPRLEELKQVQAKETELRRVFENKQKKAANLERYKAQLEEMRRSFGALLQQLPSKTEIPGLILDISQTALSAGLKIELFKPGPEVKRDFYAEKPIQLRLRGGYHQIANFVSGLAALPRIVTLHNISLTPAKDGDLVFSATAKTYRYLEEEE
jgi:type IV pilus assembly protein PilO